MTWVKIGDTAGACLKLDAIDAKMAALGAEAPDAILVDPIQTELAQQVLMRRQHMRFQRTVLRTFLISEISDDDQVRDKLLDLATRRDSLIEFRANARLVLVQFLLALIGTPISVVLTARGWVAERKATLRRRTGAGSSPDDDPAPAEGSGTGSSPAFGRRPF